MSKQAIEQFRAKMESDEALGDAVIACFPTSTAVETASYDQVVALAATHGFVFTAAEAKEIVEAEMSEKELDSVAGGVNMSVLLNGNGKKKKNKK